MSGTTPELNLRTAVDSDDNADYLTLDLANSLRSIDALFNNVTGHTHGAAHQGGPIIIGAGQIAPGSVNSSHIADGSISTIDLADGCVTSAKLSPPIDIAGYFRSTSTPSLPSTGAGLELGYNSNVATIQSYDRGATAYRPLNMLGSNIALTGTGTVSLTSNSKTMTLDTSGNLTLPGTLSVTGNTSVGGGLVVTGGTTIGNQLYFAGGTAVYWSWNGAQLAASHPIISGGAVYFSNNTGVFWAWNGTQLGSSHSILMGGPNLYFSGNAAIYIVWNGTQLGFSHPIISGGAVYLGGSTSVGISWDGTWQQHLNNVSVTGVVKSTGQICTSNAYNGSNSNGFLAPNSNPGGVGLAQSWGTYACVDHAVEYGLRHEPIHNALFLVKSVPGWSYDHTQFAGSGEVLREPDGSISTRPLYGFKASDVAEYLPELVGFGPDGEPQSIDLDRMVVVLWEAFKQQAQKTDARLDHLERISA